jgi:flagellar basal body rod protein FlgC
MNAIIATALSGLGAARKRLEASAANVANADSDGALPLRVSQQPLAPGGMVAGPDVDLVREGINRLTASRAYEANAQILRVGLALERETIDALGSRKRVNVKA